MSETGSRLTERPEGIHWANCLRSAWADAWPSQGGPLLPGVGPRWCLSPCPSRTVAPPVELVTPSRSSRRALSHSRACRKSDASLRHGPCHAGMLLGTRHRLVRLLHPKKWYLQLYLITSHKCPAVTGRDSAGVAAAVVGVADVRSAAGCPPA